MESCFKQDKKDPFTFILCSMQKIKISTSSMAQFSAYFGDRSSVNSFVSIFVNAAILVSVIYFFIRLLLFTTKRRRSKTVEPSPLVLAQLARAVYLPLHKALPLHGKWQRLDRVIQRSRGGEISDDKTGDNINSDEMYYYDENSGHDRVGAVVDVFECGNNLVLSVRGTDPSFVGDLTEDSKLFLDRLKEFADPELRRYNYDLPNYATFVLAVMKTWECRFPNHRKYLTGHSLGAACCEAAWAADLTLKTSLPQQQTTAQRNTTNNYLGGKGDLSKLSSSASSLWRCVTWESPGFAIPSSLQNILNKHQDELDSHVVHYLGAPNVINCLHPHISARRRYRVLLSRESHLSVWHLLGCFCQDAFVLLNWISLTRVALSISSSFFINASNKIVATTAESSSTVGIFCFRDMLQNWYSGCMSGTIVGKQQLLAIGAELNDYADWLSATENFAAVSWLQHIVPFGSGSSQLTWGVINRNALLQGHQAVDYLMQQHSLCNMIDSFDTRNGFPIKFIHMSSWPSMPDMVSGSVMESLRSMMVMPSLQSHMSPSVKLESCIQRLSNYVEGRVISSQMHLLQETYNYLGTAFFEENNETRSLAVLERQCRQEYRRIGRRLPNPVYILGREE